MRNMYTYTARVDWRRGARKKERFIRVIVYANNERLALADALKWFTFDHGADYTTVEFLLYSVDPLPI